MSDFLVRRGSKCDVIGSVGTPESDDLASEGFCARAFALPAVLSQVGSTFFADFMNIRNIAADVDGAVERCNNLFWV